MAEVPQHVVTILQPEMAEVPQHVVTILQPEMTESFLKIIYFVSQDIATNDKPARLSAVARKLA